MRIRILMCFVWTLSVALGIGGWVSGGARAESYRLGAFFRLLSGTPIYGGNLEGGAASAIVIQSGDQKRVVGGAFTSAGGSPMRYSGRLNADGTLDTTFALAGTGLNNRVNTLAIDASGRVVVGGTFTSYNETTRNRIARLNADGSLDTTFVPTGTGLNDEVQAIAIDSLGRVVVGGLFTNYDGTTRNRIVRLNSDGSLDTTFAPVGTGLNNWVAAIAIDGSGRIVLGGNFTSYDGTTRNYVARLNANGSLDASFAPVGTGLNGSVDAIAIDGSGRIVVGGAFTNYNGTTQNYVLRLNTDGSLDTSFAQSGTGLSGWVSALAIDSSGRIVVAGNFTNYNGTTRNYVARLATDGSLDTTFAPTGTGMDSWPLSLGLDASGRVVVGGNFFSYDGTTRVRVARLNTDGTLDTTFASSDEWLNGAVREVAIDGSGRIVLGGQFTSFGTKARNYVARLSANGSVDATFSQTGTGLSGAVNALAIDGSARIIVGGGFTNYNGTTRNRIARLNTDGSLDTTFAPAGTGLNSTVMAVAIDGSGRIVAGGFFTSYNGTTRNRIARLNADGTLDTTFAPAGTGLNGAVRAVAIDGSGKLVVGGNFTSYNGTARNSVARLNADGSLDTTFAQSGTGLNGSASALAIDGLGRIVVGGSFTNYNGTTRNRIARLNADGSLDTAFAPTGTGLNGTVTALAIDGLGRIVVGGSFTSYDVTTRNYVARLNADGSLDTTFGQTGTGLNGAVNALAIDGSSRLAVVGAFTFASRSWGPGYMLLHP